jgi:Tfp pilus assembly protein PilZ
MPRRKGARPGQNAAGRWAMICARFRHRKYPLITGITTVTVPALLERLQEKVQAKIGDEVFLILDIWCEPEKFNISGKVVWVTPENAQNGKKAGFGVQFSETESKRVSSTIERILGNSMNSKYDTLTM